MQMQLTFRSGAQVEVDVEAIRSLLSGRFTELKWKTPDEWTHKLIGVDLDEIVCIVAITGQDNTGD